MAIPNTFRCFRIHNDDRGHRSGIEEASLGELSPGEVTLAVAWSSVNYKDALAGTGNGRILRSFPLVGGIDVAGHVLRSRDGRWREGDAVLVTGCGLSETRDGGYSQYLNLDADDIVALPDGLDLRQAMALGTAGFTAALCLLRMEHNGQKPEAGPILVTGATGGVGMLAISLLTGAGYQAHALTGKFERLDELTALGAASVLDRRTLTMGMRPLESARWAGAIDCVGDEILGWLTRVIQPRGNIAACGMAGGNELHTTVMPFILRAINLLGIAAGSTDYPTRQALWQRLAGPWRPPHLEQIAANEVGLEDLPGVFEAMLSGKTTGRTLVRIGGD
ncbi:MAG: oxidoreductase [Xanthomonadales bacterium]|nr:oxidoreductase [Xanthomonadales bacterium]